MTATNGVKSRAVNSSRRLRRKRFRSCVRFKPAISSWSHFQVSAPTKPPPSPSSQSSKPLLRRTGSNPSPINKSIRTSQEYTVCRQYTFCCGAENPVYITIDETDRRPFYRQVVDEIKGLIARGELSEGSSLPPVRQVASDLGVNLNTIAFAYRKLQQEGLIRIKHGSGAVVT